MSSATVLHSAFRVQLTQFPVSGFINCYIEMTVFTQNIQTRANSIDPDRMPQIATYHQVLDSLPLIPSSFRHNNK